MNDRELHDLWTRKLDGQPLTADEQNALQAAITQRADQSREPGQADELFDDWQIDAMLRTEIELDTDRFVERFAERLSRSEAEIGTQGSDLETDPQIQPPPVVRPPIAPPPVTPPPRVARGYALYPVGARNRRWQSWGYAASAAALLFVMVASAIVLAIRISQSDTSNVARDTKQMKETDDENKNVKVKPFSSEQDNPSDHSPEKQAEIGESDLADKGQLKNQDSGKANKLPQDDRKAVPLEIVDADNGEKSNDPKNALESNDSSPQDQPRAAIARLTSSEGARWDNGYEPQRDLLPGSLSLVEGTVEITMDNGTALEITGPIELELAAKDHVALRSGRLSAHVPKQAVGFTVQTPTSKIVDLGTEFVVDVDKDKSTAVQVTQGVVEVSAIEKGRKADEQTWRLQAGDYKWISGDGRQSLDWRLVVELGDAKKNSEILIDQTRYDMSRPDQAVAAMVDINNRLNEASLRLSELPRGETFSGAIVIDGKSNTFDTSRKFTLVRQALMQEMQKRWMGNMMKQVFPEGVLPKGFPKDFFESNGFNFFPN